MAGLLFRILITLGAEEEPAVVVVVVVEVVL